MHEWRTRNSENIMRLIDDFMGFEFDTDHSGREEVTNVIIKNHTEKDETSARRYVTGCSYGGNTAYICSYGGNKLTKAYKTAYETFLKYRDNYAKFKKDLTIGYGRTASKVTCPTCGSSISLSYGRRFKRCPVCNDTSIISDSNWKSLETKKNMMYKASDRLAEEAIKNNVMFMCGIEWHC